VGSSLRSSLPFHPYCSFNPIIHHSEGPLILSGTETLDHIKTCISPRGKGIDQEPTRTSSGSDVNAPSNIHPSMDETSATFPPSNTEDEGSFYSRQAFAKVDMKIQEGFFLSHPALPDDVKTLLKPLACIPSSLKSMVAAFFHSSDFSILS
jgi:hypothetical protein